MYLGVDLGTASVKVLAWADGKVVRTLSRPYPVDAPKKGWAETDPALWQAAICDAVKALELPDIKAISFSGQMHGVVLCDEAGRPLRPAVLWADTRSSPQLSHYKTLTPQQRRRLANPITAGMAGPSLLWLREHESHLYEAARYALQPKDWLRFWLTGEVASEPSDASATLLYDLSADSWVWDVIGDLGLRSELLPPLLRSKQIAGHLTSASAKDLGLKTGIPVVAGGGDAACSAYGSGLRDAGAAQINIGTAMQIMVIVDSPKVRSEPVTHLYRTVEDGTYAMAAMQNAGLALEYLRSQLSMSWHEMYSHAFSAPAGCAGLTFLPHLSGERTPHLNPDARGALLGLGLHHGREHLARAAFEGVAFALREGFEALQAVTPLKRVRLSGGGSVRGEWRTLLADVLGVELYASELNSTSARGAALLAARALGEEEAQIPGLELVTTPANNAELEQAYLRFKERYAQLQG